MKKTIVAFGIFSFLATMAYANELQSLALTFIAPSVSNITNVQSPETGLIVYNNNDEQFYGQDALGKWRPLSSSATQTETVFIRDVKSSGTNGGTFTSGAWQVRDLNAISPSPMPAWVSVTSNQITLQAGSYIISAAAPSLQVNANRIRLWNVTDSATAILGRVANSNAATGVMSDAFLSDVITITSPKTFELQHRGTTTRASDGFGVPAGFGVDEIYSEVQITEIAI